MTGINNTVSTLWTVILTPPVAPALILALAPAPAQAQAPVTHLIPAAVIAKNRTITKITKEIKGTIIKTTSNITETEDQ